MNLWQVTCDGPSCFKRITVDNPHGTIQRDLEQSLLDQGWRFLIPEAPVKIRHYCPECLEVARNKVRGEDRIVNHVVSQ